MMQTCINTARIEIEGDKRRLVVQFETSLENPDRIMLLMCRALSAVAKVESEVYTITDAAARDAVNALQSQNQFVAILK